jgi:hypothetical protein
MAAPAHASRVAELGLGSPLQASVVRHVSTPAVYVVGKHTHVLTSLMSLESDLLQLLS